MSEPVVCGPANLVHIAPAHSRPMPKIDSFGATHGSNTVFHCLGPVLSAAGGVKECAAFVVVCAALFGALYAAAATYGAGKSTYVSVMGALLAPPRDESMEQTIANFCDARINWMAINGPDGHMTRARIYSQLDQACPDNRDAIDKLRLTRPA